MSSQLQIAANRRNAEKSTGPRSVEGKAISSRNSFQTGIYAESAIIRGENAKDLQRLLDEYFTRFQPATPEDRAFVDTLAHDEWLLRRFRRIEAELFEYRFGRLDLYLEEDEDEHTNAGEAYDCEDATLARLQRRISETERSFLRTLKELERHRAESHLQPEPVAAVAAPPRPAPRRKPASPETAPLTPAAKPIGFVPQNVPEPAPEAPPKPPLPPAA